VRPLAARELGRRVVERDDDGVRDVCARAANQEGAEHRKDILV